MGNDVTVSIGASADFRKAQEALRKFQNSVETVATRSAVAFAGFSAAIVGTGRAFSKFDNQLKSVKTLLDESSFGTQSLEKGFEQMRSDVLRLSKEAPVSIEKLNKSLFDAVSAGVDAGKAVEFVGTASKLATAGLTDVSIATDGLTSALNAYKIGAEESEIIASKFFTAQKFGKTTIEELSSGFGLVGATAESMGVKFNELLGSVSAVTLAGIKTNSAYTGLKALLSNIAKPTADAAKEAQRLGVSFDAASLRSKGLEVFLRDLASAQGFTKDSITKLFGSVEAQNIAFALTGSQAQKFSQVTKELSNEQKTAATFTQAFTEQNSSLENASVRLGNKIQVLAIQIGEKLSPFLTEAVDFASEMFDTFSRNEEFVETAAKVLLAGAALTGLITTLSTTILVGSKAAALFSALKGAMISADVATKALTLGVRGLVGATGIGLILVAISLLLSNWDGTFKDLKRIFFDTVKAVSNVAGAFGKLLVGAFTFDTEKVKEGFDEIKALFSQTNSEMAEELQNSGLASVQKRELDSLLEKSQETNQALIESENEKNLLLQEAQLQHDAALLEIDQQSKAQKVQAQISQDQLTEQLEKKHKLNLLKIQQEFRQKHSNAEFQRIEDEKKANLAEKLRREQEETRHGSTLAAIKSTFRSKEFQATQETFGALSTLTRSKNRQLFEIGKAASIANAIVNVAQGVTRALAQYPPPFSFAAAAAQGAAGAVQISAIQAQRFQRGGLVEGGVFGKDSVPSFLTPGELVVPRKDFDSVVDAVALKRASENSSAPLDSELTFEHVFSFRDGFDQFIEKIESKLIERRELGIAQGGL